MRSEVPTQTYLFNFSMEPPHRKTETYCAHAYTLQHEAKFYIGLQLSMKQGFTWVLTFHAKRGFYQ